VNPVVPNHFGGSISDGDSFFNVRLRIGEVQKVFFPEEAENISKRFVEYQVWVQHRANGTAVTKIYDHCIAIDRFGSPADFSYQTYRADPSATRKSSGRQLRPGRGAKVLLLCVNGESNNAVILGGVRDAGGPVDKKETGHHLHERFNGVDVVVNKDGELVVTYGGATKLDGTLADGVDEEAVGTFVKISKNGNLLISDAKGENKVLLDRATGKVQVVAKNEVDVVAPKVRQGDTETDDPAVTGRELKALLTDLISAINKITVNTIAGPSSPPLNVAEFSAIKGRLDEMLSSTVFVKR
jgi:hypothetical protein